MKLARTLLLLTMATLANGLYADPPSRLRELPVHNGARVLFIGNSLTGRTINGVGGWANNALKSIDGPQLGEIHRVQIWAQPLETHWNISREALPKRFDANGQIKGESTLLGKGLYAAPEFSEKGYITALEAIRNGTPEGKPWDYVVLQDFQEEAADNQIEISAEGEAIFHGGFFIYADRYIREIRATGAEPILYMRWLQNPNYERGGREVWRAAFQRLIDNTWTLARHHNVAVVPIGEITLDLIENKPDPALADDWMYSDGIHGNGLGVGLCGYAFASVLGNCAAPPMTLTIDKYKVGLPAEDRTAAITAELDLAIKQCVERHTAPHRRPTP
jgi:hypothetical protein